MPLALLRVGLLVMAGLCVMPPALQAQAAELDSLYVRLGGKPVVSVIVSDTIGQVVADHKLKRSFANTDIERIKRLLVEQICDSAGGGCHYSGDSMSEVHAGHQITEAEFYGMVEILRASMVRHHVAVRERNELLALLAPMKRDIVEAPAPPRSVAR